MYVNNFSDPGRYSNNRPDGNYHRPDVTSYAIGEEGGYEPYPPYDQSLHVYGQHGALETFYDITALPENGNHNITREGLQQHINDLHDIDSLTNIGPDGIDHIGERLNASYFILDNFDAISNTDGYGGTISLYDIHNTAARDGDRNWLSEYGDGLIQPPESENALPFIVRTEDAVEELFRAEAFNSVDPGFSPGAHATEIDLIKYVNGLDPEEAGMANFLLDNFREIAGYDGIMSDQDIRRTAARDGNYGELSVFDDFYPQNPGPQPPYPPPRPPYPGPYPQPQPQPYDILQQILNLLRNFFPFPY